MIGKTLSHYKVIEKIGQGGMGEVYRAEDTNLSRDVAIKVLPEQFTKDPQRLARFEREAKLLASLNHPRIAELERINDHVNDAVSPVTDLDLYGKVEVWTYPSGKGDCEDYVLLKRRMLIERGWPDSTLLITVVRDENNEGHAVLTVRTDRGDLVLDNKRRQVTRWNETPYTFIKRQSERDPLVWTSLLPPSGMPQPAVSASNRH